MSSFLSIIPKLSTDELIAYHRDHKRSGMKKVRANVALATEELKRRATKVVYAPQGAKVSVKADTSAMPEMQTDLLHEGPHPRANLPWSIKNTRKASALSTVPQDFSSDDEAVTEEIKLSPAARVLTGETVHMRYGNYFAVSIAYTPGSTSTVRVTFEPSLTAKQCRSWKQIWANGLYAPGAPGAISGVPAIGKSSLQARSAKKGGKYFRLPKRLLPAVMLRLEEL